MPIDIDDLPWRYRDDAFYQKGAFSIEFRTAPMRDEPDDLARRRALQQLLLALRDEVGLKVSAFIDIWEPEDEDVDYASAEFTVYNKLGVTSLGKLRRFMMDHLKGDVTPRLVTIDPETKSKFRCTHFTIRYLFHEFIAHQPPDDWERLRELLAQEDRGYGELMRSARHGYVVFRGHQYRPL